MPEEVDDPELMRAFKSGDLSAREAVWRKYEHTVRRWLEGGFPCRGWSFKGFGRGHAEVDDCLQEVYRRGMKHELAVKYERGRPYSAVLRMVAQYVVIDQARRHRRTLVELGDGLASTFEDPGDLLDQASAEIRVEVYRSALSPRDRDFFERSMYLDDASVRELARHYGISRRAVQKWREHLWQQLLTFFPEHRSSARPPWQ